MTDPEIEILLGEDNSKDVEIPVRVLLIEDSEEDGELLLDELCRGGYEPHAHVVKTAAETEAALDGGVWDIIFADRSLPTFSGLEALDLIRARGLDIPTILVSGEIDEEDAVTGLRAGAKDFISKARLARLVPAVERELREAKARAELRATEAEVESARERYRLIVEAAGEGIWKLDPDGRTNFVNRRMVDMLGYAEDELLGRPPLDFLAEDDRSRDEETFAKVRDGARGQYEFTLQRKDGVQVYVIVSASPLYEDDGGFSGSLGLVADITERKLAERRLSVEHAVASVIAESPEKDEALVRILRSIGRGLGWDAAAFWEVRGDGEALICRQFWKVRPELAEFEEVNRSLTLQRGNSLPGKVWLEDQPLWLADVRQLVDLPDYPRAEVTHRCGLQSAFGYPVTVGNRLLGVMEFLSGRISEPDVQLLQTMGVIGGQIGQFLERAEGVEHLRLSEAHLVEAQRIARMGSWEWEIATDTVIWSDELARLFGMEPGEFAGSHEAYLELVHPDDRARVADLIGDVAATATLRSYEARYVRPDNVVRVIHTDLTLDTDEEGRTVRIAGAAQDVTERAEAEKKLRESDERFRAVFESVAVGIHVVDPGGTIVQCNDAFAQMLGYEAAALEGRSILSITHPDDEAASADLSRRLFEGETDFVRVERRYLARDGATVWTQLFDVPIRDEEGAARFGIGLVEDLRERRLLEEQFLQAQKMEAVGRLAGGIAHDFNNLLLAISGYSELALADVNDESQVRESLTEIKGAADRAARLTRELLAFSRKEFLQPSVLDLNEVIRGAEGLLRQVIGESELVTSLDPALGRVKIDPNRMEQTIVNLAINARDAMPSGGRLELRTANVVAEEPTELDGRTLEPGRYVVLTVSDTGEGMDDEIKRQIFEPFFTTKAEEKGTGLGLSTVFGFVNQSNGYMLVESEPARGTTFQIFLPRADEPGEEEDVSEPKRATGARTVLLVEDDDAVRKMLGHVLEGAGYRVARASNGLEAVKLAEGYSSIDVIVTDLLMPEMGGRAAVEQIVPGHPETVVIYMSGYASTPQERESIAEGAPFLRKPFSPGELLEKIASELAVVSERAVQ